MVRVWGKLSLMGVNTKHRVLLSSARETEKAKKQRLVMGSREHQCFVGRGELRGRMREDGRWRGR